MCTQLYLMNDANMGIHGRIARRTFLCGGKFFFFLKVKSGRFRHGYTEKEKIREECEKKVPML